MIYKFRDYKHKDLYTTNGVIFVCGSYPVFNSLVVDRARESCKGEELFDEETLKEIMEEFGGDFTESRQGISYDEFLDYVRTPSIVGRWFCSVDFKLLTAKQKERLWTYIRKPNENGLLVVTATEYKDIKVLRKNGVIDRSKFVGLINLQYPPKDILKEIVKDLFKERRVDIDDKSINYFLVRLSESYNDYTTVIDNMIVGLGDSKIITFDKAKDLLRNTSNYVFDEFVMALTKPLSSVEISRKRKIYKMLDSMLETMSAGQIANRLLNRINTMIQFRIIINQGKVPLLVRYSANECKEALGDEHPLSKINNISFKKSVYLASRTTLKDWYFMRTILMNRKSTYDDAVNLRALLTIIHRGVISNDRLMNNMGIKNTLNESLFDINIAGIDALYNIDNLDDLDNALLYEI